jgi:hypothetical protein
MFSADEVKEDLAYLNRRRWYSHPIYTVGSFFFAIIVFFLVPWPWYVALPWAVFAHACTVMLSAVMHRKQMRKVEQYILNTKEIQEYEQAYWDKEIPRRVHESLKSIRGYPQ